VTAEYEIARYRPEFREGVLRIHAWHPDPSVHEAYFHWKHERNPYQPGPLAWVALRAGEVVGIRTFFATRWEAGPERAVFHALYADDFAIAPAHRNRGLVTRILQTAFRELASGPHDLAINLSAGGVTYLASLAAGWRSVVRMDPLGRTSRSGALFSLPLRVLRRVPLLRGFPARLVADAAGLSRPFAGLDRARTRRAGRIAPTIVVEREPRPEAMAELVVRLPYDGRIRHVRDAVYLSWRYRNPMHEYRFLYREVEGGGLGGYLALHSNRVSRWPGRLSIVDWEARDEATRMELLDAVLGCGGFAELAVWSSTVEPRTRTELASRGFRPVDPARSSRGYPCLLVRPIRPGLPLEERAAGGRRLLAPESWDLRMIYSMYG
jgi:hypothetical protein